MARLPEEGPKPYTITAYDDADDDGGTLYVLRDHHQRIVTSYSWPQPLEYLAHIVGHPVLRITTGQDGARIHDD